jgi:hypothetical protein
MDEKISIVRSNKPKQIYSAVIAVTRNNNTILIDADPFLYEIEVIDKNDDLSDTITSNEKVPTNVGVYDIKICVESYRCNHPLDPEEWDMKITIVECEKIDLGNRFHRRSAVVG